MCFTEPMFDHLMHFSDPRKPRLTEITRAATFDNGGKSHRTDQATRRAANPARA